MLSGYTVSVRNTNVVQVGSKAPNSKKFVAHVRMTGEVYHMLPCPQLSLLVVKSSHFLFSFNKFDFPKFPQSFLHNRPLPSSQLLLLSPETESVTVNVEVLLPPKCRKSLYSSVWNATNNNRYKNMLWKLEKFCKYSVIRLITLTCVVSICGKQCNYGICNTNKFLHLPQNTYSAAVSVSRDSTSSSMLEATFLRHKLHLQIFCYSVFLSPCDEFFPVKLICVVSNFGCSSTVQKRPSSRHFSSSFKYRQCFRTTNSFATWLHCCSRPQCCPRFTVRSGPVISSAKAYISSTVWNTSNRDMRWHRSFRINDRNWRGYSMPFREPSCHYCISCRNFSRVTLAQWF